jgi:hypothetical protein
VIDLYEGGHSGDNTTGSRNSLMDVGNCAGYDRVPVRRLLVLLLACLALPGCSKNDDETPAGCLAGGDAVLKALESAPGRVTVEGTLLSDCLSDTTDAGELQEVGAAYLEAASALADRAAEDPRHDAALQLGYLIGAVKRSEAGAQGIGYELGRRLQTEAARVPEGSTAFERGRQAGVEGG